MHQYGRSFSDTSAAVTAQSESRSRRLDAAPGPDRCRGRHNARRRRRRRRRRPPPPSPPPRTQPPKVSSSSSSPCFGAAARLPLVFLGFHARAAFGFSWPRIGAMLGSSAAARAGGNLAAHALGPAAAHLACSLCGLLGHAGFTAFHASAPRFWTSIVPVGLSEVIVPLQAHARRDAADLSAARAALRRQYAWAASGSAAGFAAGGALYHRLGAAGAARSAWRSRRPSSSPPPRICACAASPAAPRRLRRRRAPTRRRSRPR
jgi:hypothetical protein